MLNKPTIFGYPPLWKPPYDNIPRTSPLCRANFHQVGRPLSTRGGKSNASGAGLSALGCQLCEWSKGSSKWYRNRYAMLDTPTNVYANLYMMFPMYIYIYIHMYANVYAKLYCIHTHTHVYSQVSHQSQRVSTTNRGIWLENPCWSCWDTWNLRVWRQKRGYQICQRGSMGKNMEKLSHGFRVV